ncbi:MAG TPA: type II toxin-antitoxin system RelE/ParE family toxin [Steroidobacteraceae bacterium]|nr:type II toxin-antitoxin system RelE/ParE family toxin [Steroidobacteraceae bacterium]
MAAARDHQVAGGGEEGPKGHGRGKHKIVQLYTSVYNHVVAEVLKTAEFDAWLSSLRDRQAVARITARIDRLAHGNPGDVKPVGAGVSEMRIDYGPGYRVYYQQRGPVIALLLCGGDKRTQDADVKQALKLAANWKG